ncbi:MAG: hypothetical protein K2Q12_07035 [Rickettsiales bacterium]|nr:hypothetical protein [Rickettsiales bacterium]
MKQPKTSAIGSSKLWAQAWQSEATTVDAIVSGQHGNQKFPDADTRQHQLIALVIDAALMTALYETIKRNFSQTDIGKFLHLSGSSGTPVAIEDVIQRVHTIKARRLPRDEEHKELFAYVMGLQEDGYVKNHRNLVSDEVWERYIDARANSHLEWQYYDDRYQEWTGSGREGDAPVQPMISPNPDDPRRLTCNELTKQWIEIPASGVKTRESIERKIRDRFGSQGIDGQKLGAYLRDVNRLMITPDVPATAEVFIDFLQGIHPAKSFETSDFSRTFVEPWSVKTQSLQFDRMVYVALDRLEDGHASEGMAARVAEIKIVGAQMAAAESLTAPLYDALKEFRDPNRFFSDSQNAERKGAAHEARNRLLDILKREKSRFEVRRAKLFPTSHYQFPDIPSLESLSRPDTYTQLASRLVELSREIHIDALNRESGDHGVWPETFLYHAHLQRARVGGRGEGRIEDHVLNRVGNGDSHWRESIAVRARADARPAPPSKIR